MDVKRVLGEDLMLKHWNLTSSLILHRASLCVLLVNVTRQTTRALAHLLTVLNTLCCSIFEEAPAKSSQKFIQNGCTTHRRHDHHAVHRRPCTSNQWFLEPGTKNIRLHSTPSACNAPTCSRTSTVASGDDSTRDCGIVGTLHSTHSR